MSVNAIDVHAGVPYALIIVGQHPRDAFDVCCRNPKQLLARYSMLRDACLLFDELLIRELYPELLSIIPYPVVGFPQPTNMGIRSYGSSRKEKAT